MKQMNWKELPHAGTVLKAGNAHEYKTGSWRSLKPRWIEENCIQCLFCWIYCPESAVLVKDEKMIGYDYDHCKGCGVCAMECPGTQGTNANVMEEEGTYQGCDNDKDRGGHRQPGCCRGAPPVKPRCDACVSYNAIHRHHGVFHLIRFEWEG